MKFLKFLNIFIAATMLATPVLATQACYPEGPVTVRGTIVQSAFTDEGGIHKFLAIVFDRPICDALMGKKDKKILLPVEVSEKWLGHYVVVTGHLGDGEDWTISVNSIKDVNPNGAPRPSY